MHRPMTRVILSAVIVAVLALVANSCATNPVTNRTEFMLLSRDDELAMGEATDPEILASYGEYEDAGLAAYLGALGKRLGAVSHQPDIPYTVKVLDSPVVNAFAVPGGYVYLTRGILAYLNDEAELAGVISHEVGHIAARHSAQQYSKAQAAQLGLGIGSILSPTFAKLAGLAQAGISMLFLSFSRDNERQADDLGVLYSSKAGFDARQMANLFVTLERLDPSGGRDGLPAWFSTHPNPPDRIVAIRKAAEEWQKANPQAALAMNRDRYLQQLDGLAYGEDPRRGYVSGQVFYHPELRFQFPVPAGWTVNNTASQVQIFTEEQDAVILLSIAAESTPAAAADAFVSGTEAAVVSSAAVQVNGMAAQRVVCDVATDSGVLRSITYFIKKDSVVYGFLGYTGQTAFDGRVGTFETSMKGFRNLTDSARINVRPDRVALRKVSRAGTLRQVLLDLGVPQDGLEEHAIMNGKELAATVAANTLLKVVVDY
jgi:predicted Zn-dependent protease